MKEAGSLLQRAEDYSEYISRPLRYIEAAGRKKDDIFIASRQLYPLIFKRLKYRSRGLIDSLTSSQWSRKCLHKCDPILERDLLLFKYKFLGLRTQVHSGLPCLTEKCEIGPLCPITLKHSDNFVTNYTTFVHRHKTDVKLFPAPKKFQVDVNACEVAIRISNQKMLWFHLHGTSEKGSNFHFHTFLKKYIYIYKKKFFFKIQN